jgi:hypothetical protein
VSPRTITAYLVSDHARLHGLLARAAVAPHLDPVAFADFRRGLLRHIAIEEKLLFPAVREAQRGASLDRAHELRTDHAALTSLLVPTPDLALCREILALLSLHDAKEEGAGGVYEECDHWLSNGDLMLLAERATSFPEVRVRPYFDGPKVYRTAEAALASARRLPPTKGEE